MISAEENGIRLVVCGGGTGGHLFPGIAVAETVLRRFGGSEVLFVGTGRDTDERVLANRQFKNAVVRCQGLKGKSLLQRIASLMQLPFATVAAVKLLRRFKPHLVLGVGGYVTGPVLLAAKMMGVPTCIHEQNSVPGMANRKLGLFVDRIFTSIPGSENYFKARKCVFTGNPVRQELLEAARVKKKHGNGITLLVLGGSLGAHRLNTLMMGAMAKLLGYLPDDFRIIHQTGKADEVMVRTSYQKMELKAEVAAFFENMDSVYSEADLVVSRAGATTLAETTVFGLPMILIPYPYAADNHQQKNADYLVQGGAASMFAEKELTEKRLAAEIGELLSIEKKRKNMAMAAQNLAKPAATEAIIAELQKLISH